jgi:hypothetical protein
MSCFSLTEFFGDIFISWLPLYYEAKLLLLFYLVHPQTAGALKLYDQVFRPDSADARGTPDTRSRVRTRGRPALTAHTRTQSTRRLALSLQSMLRHRSFARACYCPANPLDSSRFTVEF